MGPNGGHHIKREIMSKSYLINNVSTDFIGITELTITLPPGISNAYELNKDLTPERIDYSVKNGTLGAAILNGICQLVSSSTSIIK